MKEVWKNKRLLKNNNMYYVKFLILSGVDSSGKSSFKHIFNKKTGSTWCVIDRLFGSLIAYGKYNNRQDVDFDKYYEMDSLLAKEGGVVIYLYTDIPETLKRLRECGDDDITIDDIMPLQIAYEDYLRRTNMLVIRINTTNLSKDEVVDKAIEQLNRLNCKNYYETT